MNNKKVLYGVVGLIAVVAVAAGVYLFMQYSDDTAKDDPKNTSETQKETTNTDTSGDQTDEQVANTSFKSEKGVAMTITSPKTDSGLTSPLAIAGSVPGTWSNEGQFTVRLLDSDSGVLAEGSAKINGDWMSQNPVPFSATLTFDAPAAGTTGLLVLEKANPSGLEDSADSVTIMVQF